MQANREWVSISDLMAGLMMVFMFIAIVFMIQTQDEKKRIEEIALTYEKSKKALFEDLKSEFENDLELWGLFYYQIQQFNLLNPMFFSRDQERQLGLPLRKYLMTSSPGM